MDEDQGDGVTETSPGESGEATQPGADAPDARLATAPTIRVHPIGCPAASVDRLRGPGVEIVEDPSSADVTVISTRATDGSLPSPLPGASVVLVAPGSDDRAIELLSQGARALHAEGDEPSLVAAATADRQDVGTEPNAPSETIVALRLGRLAASGDRNVTSLVHRRLLTRWRTMAATVGAELSETDHAERLVLRWPDASPTDVRTLSLMLAGAAEAFLPDGAAPLRFAAGVALAGDGPDAGTRLRLANEAADLALSRGNACLTAEDALSATVTARTTATLFAATEAAERILEAPGHGERCGQLARVVGQRLGLAASALTDLTSAARFHHVGLLTAGGADACSDETRARSASLVRPHLGTGTAEAIGTAIVAACDAIDSGRTAGQTGTNALLASVEAAVPDLPADVRDALAACLDAASAPAEGQAVPA